tara:strand:+ start:678 stop:1556 length:879 start_codon:yes stop_codon:yes gene_type:complete
MSEIMSEDSTNVDDASVSTPAEESAPDLGADLAGDTLESTSEAQAGHSNADNSADFDPNNVDWLRVDANTLPDNYKPVAQLAKNFQSSYTQAQQAAREEQTRAASERQQYLNALTQIQQTYQPQQREQTPVEKIGQYLDEDEKRGLEVVNTLFQQQSAPMVQEIANLRQQLAQANQGSQAFAQYLKNQQTQQRLSQISDVREAYGSEVDDLSDRQMHAMKALVDQGNTVKEAFEAVTGKEAEQIQSARAQSRNVKTTAKRTANSGGARATTEGARVETEADLMNAMRGLGFD